MMQSTMDPKAIDPKAIYETWEKAAGAWFDVWTKSPAFIAASGKALEAQLNMKASYDKMFAGMLEAWKLPTQKDIDALAERISDLEERMAKAEDKKS